MSADRRAERCREDLESAVRTLVHDVVHAERSPVDVGWHRDRIRDAASACRHLRLPLEVSVDVEAAIGRYGGTP